MSCMHSLYITLGLGLGLGLGTLGLAGAGPSRSNLLTSAMVLSNCAFSASVSTVCLAAAIVSL